MKGFIPGLYRSQRDGDPYVALWTALVIHGGRKQRFVTLWHPLTFEMYVVRDELFAGKFVDTEGSRRQRFVLLEELGTLDGERLEELLKPIPRVYTALRDVRQARLGLLRMARPAFTPLS